MMSAGRLHQLWRALPEGTLSDVIGDGPCLILAPHPDDESLGCGGLIAACCAEGRPPMVVVLTDGSASHPGSRLYPPAKLASLRAQEVRQAVEILGLPVQRLVFLNQRDAEAPRAGPIFDDLADRLAALMNSFACTTIIAPWRHDPHCDHEAASLLAEETARRCGARLLSYPVWGWMLPDQRQIDEDAIGGWRFDIGTYLNTKQAAIAAHRSQYGQLITDDPDGFQLPQGLLRNFARPWETYLIT